MSTDILTGLLVKGTNKALPLRDVSVEADITGFVLGLRSTLKYFNDATEPAEVVFRFPLEQSHAVVGLTAVIDGRRIIAQIKEKEEARAAYDDAIASGQSAALAEEKSGDVFSISLGNLPPEKEAEIQLQLVGELGIDAEGGVRFSLPSTLKPRYTPAGSADPLGPVPGGGAGQVEAGRVAGVQGFRLRVHEASEISEVTSPTHALSVSREGEDLVVSLSEEKALGSDLVVLVRQKEPHRPKVVVETGAATDNDFMSSPVVMVNFFPDFTDVEAACEFIFLLDRSGSMRGSYIKSARETLMLFLKSIPEGSHFNIIGFGSRYELLFPVSVAYSQETLDKAVKYAQTVDADLGGTELLSPLQYIFGVKTLSGHPRQIFVLTDGSVSNTQACIQVVKKNAHSSRCFTFGIGSGASTALVEGLARAGNGTSEFVKEGERMQPKVIRSLKRALQPAVTDVRVEFKVPGGYEVTQSPQNLPPVFNGEKLVVYGILKAKGSARDGSGKAVLKGMILGKKLEHSVSFQLVPIPGAAPELASVHHLAGKALVKDWESEGRSKESVVKLSIESSVVSSHTAFVAIDEENSEPISGAMKTWDIQAMPMVINAPRALRSCGAPGGGGGGGRGGSLPLFQSSSVAFGARDKKKKSAPKGRAMAPPPPPAAPMMMEGLSEDMFGGMSAAPMPPPPSMSAAPMPPPPSMSAAPMNRRAKSAAMSSFSRNAGPQPPMDNLSSLVSTQQANGSWILNAGLSQLLGKALAELEGGCPVECRGDMTGMWATLLVLCQLRRKYSGQQDEWELIAMKAESWLKRQSLPAGMTLSDLKQAAEKTLT